MDNPASVGSDEKRSKRPRYRRRTHWYSSGRGVKNETESFDKPPKPRAPTICNSHHNVSLISIEQCISLYETEYLSNLGPSDRVQRQIREVTNCKLKEVIPFRNNATLRYNYLALDCETVGAMGKGPKFIMVNIVGRVSLVNEHLLCVYDKYVKPYNNEKIICYNTKISGITKQHLQDGEPFDVVQREVLNLLNGKILVGHALRNDLAVLHIQKPRTETRDTQSYPPFRKYNSGRIPSLKTLAKVLLGEEIQEGEHDSVIDAITAMKIYLKYKNEIDANIKMDRDMMKVIADMKQDTFPTSMLTLKAYEAVYYTHLPKLRSSSQPSSSSVARKSSQIIQSTSAGASRSINSKKLVKEQSNKDSRAKVLVFHNKSFDPEVVNRLQAPTTQQITQTNCHDNQPPQIRDNSVNRTAKVTELRPPQTKEEFLSNAAKLTELSHVKSTAHEKVPNGICKEVAMHGVRISANIKKTLRELDESFLCLEELENLHLTHHPNDEERKYITEAVENVQCLNQSVMNLRDRMFNLEMKMFK